MKVNKEVLKYITFLLLGYSSGSFLGVLEALKNLFNLGLGEEVEIILPVFGLRLSPYLFWDIVMGMIVIVYFLSVVYVFSIKG